MRWPSQCQDNQKIPTPIVRESALTEIHRLPTYKPVSNELGKQSLTQHQ
jgi:hypothetical protein